MGAPHCKAILVKSGPKMAVFRELRGLSVKFLLSNPKRHILAEKHVVWRTMRESRFGAVVVGRWKNPKKKPS